jgi:hypothetical protein
LTTYRPTDFKEQVRRNKCESEHGVIEDGEISKEYEIGMGTLPILDEIRQKKN